VDERELADLERRTRDSTAGDLRAALVALEREITVIYTAVAGDAQHALPELAQHTIRNRLSEALHGLATYDYADTRKVLTHAARTAMAGGAADVGLPVSDTLPADIRQAMTALTGNMRKDLRDAVTLARHGPMRRFGDARTVVGMARKALNHADATAVWIVHRAHNEGRSRAIDKAFSGGVRVAKLWRAERGACTFCSGMAGALAEPGEPFRPVVDVADASQAPDRPMHGPPAHPFCRCSLEWWLGNSESDLTAVDLPIALRREAQRSIASGSAIGSEPNRLRAAERLLDVAGLLIPKTVQRRAKKAVDRGEFPA
jgi:hypothetical protein